MITTILTVPHETLRKKSSAIQWDKKTAQFSLDLLETLYAKENPRGVGLSAPQIGKNWNIFATWLSPDPQNDPTRDDAIVFCNPTILDHSSEMTLGDDPEDPILEGCLSIPSLYGPVPRYTWIEVGYQTIDTKKLQTATKKEEVSLETQSRRFEGFFARVIQHEYDHLIGKLFTDYSLALSLPVYEFHGKKMTPIDHALLRAF